MDRTFILFLFIFIFRYFFELRSCGFLLYFKQKNTLLLFKRVRDPIFVENVINPYHWGGVLHGCCKGLPSLTGLIISNILMIYPTLSLCVRSSVVMMGDISFPCFFFSKFNSYGIITIRNNKIEKSLIIQSFG